MRNVEDVPELIVLGLKLTAAPAGRPLALSETDCAEPLVTAVVIVELAEPPRLTDRLDGLAPIEKSLPLIIQLNEVLPDAPVVSVAVTLAEYVPAVVGVPEITPVELLIDSPLGRPVAL